MVEYPLPPAFGAECLLLLLAFTCIRMHFTLAPGQSGFTRLVQPRHILRIRHQAASKSSQNGHMAQSGVNRLHPRHPHERMSIYHAGRSSAERTVAIAANIYRPTRYSEVSGVSAQVCHLLTSTGYLEQLPHFLRPSIIHSTSHYCQVNSSLLRQYGSVLKGCVLVCDV
jgi:hypothetical protein